MNQRQIDYSILPEHMREGMKLYIENGIPGGSFMMAVLSNNLVEAVATADHINGLCLCDYASFLYNEAPKSCWGSPEKVSDYLKQKQQERLKK